ncbi:MAG: hypothetical protein IJL85_02585 [Erysipelotrichaceae bacterium]|nr:hypothetical protein [Erysipelotrichaceae bacterium]
MDRKGFTFSVTMEGDRHLSRYHFEDNGGISFKDPFAYLSEGKDSIILDPERFNQEIVKPVPYEDIVIYETSVRDFSSYGYFGKYAKTFKALGVDGLKRDGFFMLGLDYLENLGITHLQLMPVMDFDNDRSEYNWGYNPLAFNHVKKDYVYDRNDPYAYVNELREAINKLHEHNIRVVLDVVFNHVYDAKNFDIEKMIPGHFLRRKNDGKLAMGTFCGSEIKSEDPFVRAYLVKMTLRYLELFDIDGIRIDLMGILDIDTVNTLRDVLRAQKPDFVVYGEGWNMGDALPEEQRATILNASRMPGIGMFNDHFRETIIAYVMGADNVPEVCKALSGSDYLSYDHSINYVECHDGMTFFDRLGVDCVDDSPEEVRNKCKLALSMVMTAKGTPFIHSGQEFLRTKKGISNSYNSPDAINTLSWDLRIYNNEICDYLKALIRFRKEYRIYRDDVKIGFSDYKGCLLYQIDDLLIFFNPKRETVCYETEKSCQVIFDCNGFCDNLTNKIMLSAYSMVICKCYVV